MLPSCLRSSTLAIVILLLIQHSISASTASETLSQLELLSDLINDNTDQSPNNSSTKEDDQRMVSADHDESEESTNSMDPGWMAEWRKKMDVYASWLDHFSNSYPVSRDNTFARKSRGRIDRMPLTYGKRSVRSRVIDDVNDNNDFDALGKQHQIAFESDDEWTSSSEGYSPEAKHPYTRIRKGRLNRMPLTFGKRAPGGAYFTRLPKGRLDRMPLTFGKRGESFLLDGYFTRTQKDRLNRMPLTFGKRNQKDQLNNSGTGNYFTSLTSESTMKTDADTEKETISKGTNGGDQYTRVVRDRLGRMPAMFGKRQHDDVLDNIEGASYFPRHPKSRMNRMPAMFGKRQDDEMLEDSGDSATFSRIAKSRMNRMPAMFGKREDETVQDNSEENSIFSRNAKSRIGRMPAMFGKRENEGTVENNDIFSRDAKSKLGRMPAMFGKREDKEMQGSLDESGSFFSRTAKASIDRMPAMFGKRDGASLFSRTSKGILNRMPLTFGKRKGPDTTEDLMNNNEDDFFERVSKGSLARMPMSFGKRSKSDYQELVEVLRAKLDTLPPYQRAELHERLNKFLENLELMDTPLTRLQRSRLGRMPLTYGKRGQAVPTLTDIPSESNDISNSLSNLDLLNPGLRWNTQKRLRVDRMPLAFGKRSLLEGKLLEDIILGSERASKNIISSKGTNSQGENLGHAYETSRDVDSEIISPIHMR